MSAARPETGGLRAIMWGKVMVIRTAAAVVAALCWIMPLHAEDAAPDSAGGRYIFSRIGDGYVRLDTQTGAVAQCSQRSVGWACEAAPEDRAVLENEITRLRNENAALKKEILSRGLTLPPGAMPEPPLAQNGETTIRLPSDADIDRMMAFVGKVWHRFVDAVQRAQKQILNNG
jgi:hypothetical protein